MWQRGASAPQQRHPCFGSTSPRPLTDVPFDGNFLDAGPLQSWLRGSGQLLLGGVAMPCPSGRALQSGRAWKWSQVRAPGFTPPRNSLGCGLNSLPSQTLRPADRRGLILARGGSTDGGRDRGWPPAQWGSPPLNPRFFKGPSACTPAIGGTLASAPGTSGQGETGRGRAGASLPERAGVGGTGGGAFPECSEAGQVPRVEGSQVEGCLSLILSRGGPGFGELASVGLGL